MSNGSPPTTIEAWPRLQTGRIGLVPPNVAAHIYQPNTTNGLLPPLDVDEMEDYPIFATNGVGVAPDAGVWVYQPNVPYGMIEIIPSLQPPTNVTPPLLSYVSGGGGPGNVGSTYALSAGSWTPTQPMPTFLRQWYRNGTPIGGAAGNTYTIQSADIGTTINGAVAATNPAGSSAPVQSSNSVGPIPDPTPPEDPLGRLDDNGGGVVRRGGGKVPPAKTPPPKHGKTAHHASPVHRRSSGSSKR